MTKLEFQSQMNKALVWMIVLSIIVGLMMAFFPLMKEDNLLTLAESFRSGFSPNVQHVIGVPEKLDFTNIYHFIPFIYQYIGFFLCIFALQIGSKSLVKEQTAGTISYIYGQPISRPEIVSGKFFGVFLSYLLLLFILLVVTFLCAIIFHTEGNPIDIFLHVLPIFGLLIAHGFVFICLGLFFSAIFNHSSYSDGLSLLFFIVLFLVWFIGTIVTGPRMSFLRYLSFEAFNPLASVLYSFDFMAMLINVGIGLLLLLLTYVIYSSKELKY